MNRRKKIIQISLLSVAVNVILVVVKAFIGTLAGSISIQLDAINNLGDALASVITVVGIKLASKPADKKHPYGYGRIESITSITVSIVILYTGFSSIVESVKKIMHNETASYSTYMLVIIALTILVKFFLGRYVKRSGKKYNSDSLIASGSDAVFDCLVSLSTLIAAGVSMLWQFNIEGYLGVLISILIIKAGIEIFLGGIGDIIGLRIEKDLSVRLKKKLNTYDFVLGTNNLILHRYGPEKVIGSVYIEVNGALTARELDAMTRRITEEVNAEFGIQLAVGIYASHFDSTDNAQLEDAVYDGVLEIIKTYPSVLRMHGFSMDLDHAKVVFNLIVSFQTDLQKMTTEIYDKLHIKFPEYQFHITLNNDFSD